MLLSIAGILIVGFAALVAYLYFNQHRMIFYPTATLDASPDESGLDYQEIWIDVDGERKIHAWFFPGSAPDRIKSGDDAGRPLVLFCHGNAGNMSHRIQTAEFLTGLGAAVLMFDYAGYGRSEGQPSEANAYADVEAAYRWVLSETNFATGQIVIMGRSLGGAVAVDLAARQPFRSLIVESSFTSTVDMGKRMFPFVPVNWLLKYRFDTRAKIGQVDCPVLFVHSDRDEIVPYEMGCELFESANQPKRMVTIDGSHNELYYFQNPEYRTAILQILKGKIESEAKS